MNRREFLKLAGLASGAIPFVSKNSFSFDNLEDPFSDIEMNYATKCLSQENYAFIFSLLTYSPRMYTENGDLTDIRELPDKFQLKLSLDNTCYDYLINRNLTIIYQLSMDCDTLHKLDKYNVQQVLLEGKLINHSKLDKVKLKLYSVGDISCEVLNNDKTFDDKHLAFYPLYTLFYSNDNFIRSIRSEENGDNPCSLIKSKNEGSKMIKKYDEDKIISTEIIAINAQEELAYKKRFVKTDLLHMHRHFFEASNKIGLNELNKKSCLK